MHISKTAYPNFTKLSVGLHVTSGRGSVIYDDNVIRYVLPLLRMVSCFNIVDADE